MKTTDLDPATLRWVADDCEKRSKTFAKRAAWFRAPSSPSLYTLEERIKIAEGEDDLAGRERMSAQKYRALATRIERKRLSTGGAA